MKILLVHKFLKLTGGAEVFFREVGRILQENGHAVHYLATGTPDEIDWSDKLTPDMATLIPAPTYATGSTVRKLASLPRTIWSNRARRATDKVISEFRPDVLHCFGIHVHLSPSVLAAARDAGVPTVMTCNDYKHICPNYKLFHHGRICYDCKKGRFHSAIRNRCAKNSLSFSAASALEAFVHDRLKVYARLVDHFTFSADFMASITHEFWENKAFSWSKLLNPFDSASFSDTGVAGDFGLYFGRLIDEKGVDVLVEAARNIGGFPIKIVGNGPDDEALRVRARELCLENVEFLGPLWNDELSPILSRARFVVVPSIWHENFPYVINRAFAFGRPVIGANRGGIAELVDHGKRGLIYDALKPEELATAIRQLAENPDLARRLGRTAKRWSDENFTDERFYTSLLKAYERATHAHSSSRG